MESMISTNQMNKALNHSSDEEEDSSWSLYMQEYLKSYPQTQNHNSPFSQHRTCGRLINTAKRRKVESAAFVDRDLEDTATSTDHTTPKFSIFQEHNLLQNLHKEEQDGVYSGASSQGEGDLCGVNFPGREHTSELRRKGLCLVPVSIFLDYYFS